jgi:hypothetical protein
LQEIVPERTKIGSVERHLAQSCQSYACRNPLLKSLGACAAIHHCKSLWKEWRPRSLQRHSAMPSISVPAGCMVNGDWLTRSVWENYKITILRQGAGEERAPKRWRRPASSGSRIFLVNANLTKRPGTENRP